MNQLKYVLPLLLLLLSACAPAPESSTEGQQTSLPVADGRGRLFAFGDSISYCYNCFPSALAVILPNIRLENLAQPGTRIEDSEQIGRVLATNPQPGDIVVFLTGYNNFRTSGTDPVAAASYRSTLHKALVHLGSFKQPVYVGTPMKPLCVDSASTARNGAGCTSGAHDLYAQIVRDEVASLNLSNVKLVDVANVWQPGYDNLYDMVHPNAYGTGQLATIFLKEMK